MSRKRAAAGKCRTKSEHGSTVVDDALIVQWFALLAEYDVVPKMSPFAHLTPILSQPKEAVPRLRDVIKKVHGGKCGVTEIDSVGRDVSAARLAATRLTEHIDSLLSALRNPDDPGSGAAALLRLDASVQESRRCLWGCDKVFQAVNSSPVIVGGCIFESVHSGILDLASLIARFCRAVAGDLPTPPASWKVLKDLGYEKASATLSEEEVREATDWTIDRGRSSTPDAKRIVAAWSRLCQLVPRIAMLQLDCVSRSTIMATMDAESTAVQKALDELASVHRKPTEVVYLGGGRLRIGTVTVALEGQEELVLEALVDLQAATKMQLERESGVSDAVRILKGIVKKHSLEGYVTSPGRRGAGGYQTTIQRQGG